MKLRVGVIFGGESVEHEVSIISAIQAMNKMDSEKYDIIPIYITKDREWYTGEMLKEIETYSDPSLIKKYAKNVVLYAKDNRFYLQNKKGLKGIVKELDIAFPIVHGTNVEDGVLQGYLQLVGIPFVGGAVYASAVGQDKLFMKEIFEHEKLPVCDYTWFYDTEYSEDIDTILKNIKKIGYPVIVKPATLGSSVGITVVKDEKKIEEAIEDAISYDSKIVVEKLVDNLVEVNCSVVGNYDYQEASVLEEVMSTDEFLTYKDKYLGGSKTKTGGSKGMASTDRVIPARLSKDLTKDIQETSKKIFKVLGLSGICRIDFLIDKKANKFYINEPNTIPGSLSFYLWDPSGKPYPELLDEVITLAIKDYKIKSKKTTSFDTNILSNFGGLKGAKGVKGAVKGKLNS